MKVPIDSTDYPHFYQPTIRLLKLHYIDSLKDSLQETKEIDVFPPWIKPARNLQVLILSKPIHVMTGVPHMWISCVLACG